GFQVRARWVTATQTSTASAATTVATPYLSPIRNHAQTRVSSGWVSCVWPARAMPPLASPAYQGKKPRNIEISPTYAKPARAGGAGVIGVTAARTAVTESVIGSDRTSAYEMTCQPGVCLASRPPSV